MKNTDPMATLNKQVKKPNMAMLEVDDNDQSLWLNPKGKYAVGNGKYKDLCIDLFESLGIDCSQTNANNGRERIVVMGIEYGINLLNAPKMAYLPYGRETKERKHRFVTLESNSSRFDIKIPINQPFDSDKLKKRFESAVAHKIKRAEEIDAYEKLQIANTEMVGNIICEEIGGIEQVSIHCGEIHIQVKGGHIELNKDGTIKRVCPFNHPLDGKDVLLMRSYFSKAHSSLRSIDSISEQIYRKSVNWKFPHDLQEWIEKTHHKYFDPKTMKAKAY